MHGNMFVSTAASEVAFIDHATLHWLPALERAGNIMLLQTFTCWDVSCASAKLDYVGLR
jgi:hypothetical protein